MLKSKASKERWLLVCLSINPASASAFGLQGFFSSPGIRIPVAHNDVIDGRQEEQDRRGLQDGRRVRQHLLRQDGHQTPDHRQDVPRDGHPRLERKQNRRLA